MDFQAIKDIIKKDGGKVIIVEEGEPSMVVMAFEEYRELAGGESRPQSREEPEEPSDSLSLDDLPV